MNKRGEAEYQTEDITKPVWTRNSEKPLNRKWEKLASWSRLEESTKNKFTQGRPGWAQTVHSRAGHHKDRKRTKTGWGTRKVFTKIKQGEQITETQKGHTHTNTQKEKERQTRKVPKTQIRIKIKLELKLKKKKNYENWLVLSPIRHNIMTICLTLSWRNRLTSRLKVCWRICTEMQILIQRNSLLCILVLFFTQ